MADPLRRTLLAKLRGKKSKKGATVVGGYGSAAAAAAADGGREGKEKVLQTQRDSDEARPVVLLAGLDCTSERMSTYENCVVDGAVVQTGGVIIVPGSLAAELAGASPQERSSGGRVRVNEELLGVSLQRGGQFACREGDRSLQGGRAVDMVTVVPAGARGPHVQRKHFVSVPRQCSVGDSIGFGDNSNHVFYRARVDNTHSKPPEGRGATGVAQSEGTEPRDGGQSQHMAATVVAEHEHNNANWSFDNNPALETNSPAALAHPNCTSRNAEEHILIRNIESYGPEFAADIRGSAGGLQSPTFFPTELEICDINMASLCTTEGPLTYPLDSEDEDYYDNEILPFYETIRVKSDGDRAETGHTEVPQTGQDRGQLDDCNSAQETDRLRNQLKEAYYLLINAMNDINLDVQQQISGGLTEQQAATSSCSSHSRDSLCSRLSAKNMDSDSWSSGEDHSPQQVSDIDSILLCLSGNSELGLKSRQNSKSMVNLSGSKIRPTLLRSASDGAIRYPDRLSVCVQLPEAQSAEICDEKEAKEVEGAAEVNAIISSDEQLQDAGGEEEHIGGVGQLNESSGSVNSLTGSSDGNAEAPSSYQGQDGKQEPTGARAQGANSAVNKGHGVTVNKMQEWMHKGRLLSSEMKQRIEGSSLHRGGGSQNQDRPCPPAHPGGSKQGVQASGRGVKPIKAKSPKSPRQQQQQQQPGRKATRSGLSSRGSCQKKKNQRPLTLLPPV